jgi:hypothetical protein
MSVCISKVKKIKLEKGELLFLICEHATSAGLEELRSSLPGNLKSVIMSNYDIKFKKVKTSDVTTLKIKAEAPNFELEDVRRLGDVIEAEIETLKKRKRIKKNKFEFLLKS